jgi:hypothetical protein
MCRPRSTNCRGIPGSFEGWSSYGPIVTNRVRTSYVAECFWPGVRADDLRDVDRRLRAAVGGEPVRYLGWRLVIDDDVVWLEFEGPMATVRRVAEQAQVRFERILRVDHADDPD